MSKKGSKTQTNDKWVKVNKEGNNKGEKMNLLVAQEWCGAVSSEQKAG